MKTPFLILCISLSLLGYCESLEMNATLQQQVFETERNFAASMANRDFESFSQFVDEEAIFFTGPEPLRGKAEVLEVWKRFFVAPEAPFSWEPDQVEVLPSGKLASSSGLVFDPSGNAVSRFNSIWRLNEHGQWKVVFDKGSPLE